MEFKDLAAHYDAWCQTPLGSLAHTLEQEAVFAMAGVKPGERVLDVGCGTGIYTLELARGDARVIGVDSSLEMIRIARQKFRQAGLSGCFVCASAEALSFRTERFDWSRRELERLVGRNGFVMGEEQIVLFFPPINQKTFLKYHRLFERILKRILPGMGAFIAMKGEKPLHSKGPNSKAGVFRV